MSIDAIMAAVETGEFSQALHVSSLLLSLKHAGLLVLSDKVDHSDALI